MALAPSLVSRIRGSLYGVAVTDALGGPVEFHRRGTFPLVASFQYNANFDLPPGSWTDDTSMTLCLAQSLVERQGKCDVVDQVEKYVAWFKYGYMSSKAGAAFDVGNATRVALNMWDQELKNDKKAAEERGQRSIDSSLNKEVRCGNGSLMRTTPVALIYYKECESMVDENTARAGSVTHPHALCVEACQVYVRLICVVLKSQEQLTKIALFEVLKAFEFKVPAIKDTFTHYKSLNDFVNVSEAGISSSGFVLHTLEAALWAFFSTDTFKDGAVKVVNLGDDADTVGAVYGGIAGAYYGMEEIPVEWLRGLVAKEVIDSVVEGVVSIQSSNAL